MLYFQISSVFLLFMVLDNSTTSFMSCLVLITILQRFLKRSLVVVHSFLLFPLSAFLPTSSADSNTFLVRLSFKLSTSTFTSCIITLDPHLTSL